ncbi:MAG: 4Fe-4S binding protein [Deltaproteobacteria bacterium]|jgi:2-oxoglutarate ferredoxin oxidoreductase subunit delta|nr:4Fe-4S binding protein [Deltaproteobacteria bacterium]
MVKDKIIQHLIEKEWCKGCGICVHFCPKQVLELDSNGKVEAVRPEDCIACMLCELRCPDLAIQIIENQEKEYEKQ